MQCDLRKQFSDSIKGYDTDKSYILFLESMVTSLQSKIEKINGHTTQKGMPEMQNIKEGEKMKLKFYQSPILPFGSVVFYEYDKKKSERHYCDVITKLYHDKPFSFEKMCGENALVPLFDLSKDFDNELALKNWLIDNNYKKLFGNNEYEIYTTSLFYMSYLDMKTNYNIPVYAIYIKKDAPTNAKE